MTRRDRKAVRRAGAALGIPLVLVRRRSTRRRWVVAEALGRGILGDVLARSHTRTGAVEAVRALLRRAR